ncbi:MAG: carbamate kinase [Thermoplasmata archaeon]
MKTVVVAIGGNAIIKEGQFGTVEEQFANFDMVCEQIVKMVKLNYNAVLTHGNGPQVGNSLIRMEEAATKVPTMPLDVCDAETQGSMGYMLQQTLLNKLKKARIKKPVISVITQVLVSEKDPAIKNPTKPIGPFYTKEKAEKYSREKGWNIVEDSGRGYRRVVPSPKPIEIIEREIIKKIIASKGIVIACGGGGIPVIRKRDGAIAGVEAVIDKDMASSKLASEIGAELLVILTDVEKVAVNFKKEDQRDLDRITIKEAKRYIKEGEFPPGSMGPKVMASIVFLESGGKEVVITSTERLIDALNGKTGTRITK